MDFIAEELGPADEGMKAEVRQDIAEVTSYSIPIIKKRVSSPPFARPDCRTTMSSTCTQSVPYVEAELSGQALGRALFPRFLSSLFGICQSPAVHLDSPSPL